LSYRGIYPSTRPSGLHPMLLSLSSITMLHTTDFANFVKIYPCRSIEKFGPVLDMCRTVHYIDWFMYFACAYPVDGAHIEAACRVSESCVTGESEEHWSMGAHLNSLRDGC